MSNFKDKFLNRLFCRVEGLVWDLTTGKLGYNKDDTILTFSLDETGTPEKPAQTPRVNVNLFANFGMAIPAFATNTALEDIKVGDVVVGAKRVMGWVTEVKGASLTYLDFDGHNKTWTPPKVAIVGDQSGTLIVKNLTTLLGGDAGRAGLESQLLPLLMLQDGDKGGLDDMLPILLMGQMNGTGGGNIGQMLMMKSLMGGKTGGGGDMMETMLMMQMLGGGGMGGMFGGAAGAGAAGGMNPLMMMALMGKGGSLLGGSDTPSTSVRMSLTPSKPPLTRLP